MIEEFGKGCQPDPVDIRDYKIERMAGAVQVDWTKQTNNVEKIKFWRNQGNSLSCTGHACAYVSDIKAAFPLDAFSARSIYGYIFQPAGGAYIRDAILRRVKYGIARQSEALDIRGGNEADYRKTDDITDAELQDDRAEDGYVLPSNDMDYTAWAIQNFDAVLLGVNGTNTGWANLTFPRPPQEGDGTVWGHALAAVDLDIINDKKYITCLSSWTNFKAVHYLSEEYFKTNNVFNPWVIIPRKEKMAIKRFEMADGKTFGVLIDTPNGFQGIKATNEEQWRSWSRDNSYQLPTVNPDGSTNWMADYKLPF